MTKTCASLCRGR